jgi:methyl-accepting chemotaxis protein
MSIKRLSRSLSIRLQAITIILSLVGIGYGVKSYFHVHEKFGAEASEVFFNDLIIQLLSGIVLNVLASYIIYHIATKPLRTLGEVMRGIVEGNLDIEVPYVKEETEIGSMARKVAVFKKNALDKKHLEAEQKLLEEKTKHEKTKAMNDLADSFESSIGAVVNIVGSSSSQMSTSANSLSSTAEATARQAKAVSVAMNEASTNVQTVASATEELASSINEISRRVEEASAIAAEAVSDARQTHIQMQELSDASQKIGHVVSLISDIAGQTNLLALNATIEAARAGDAGKGFAVVATEVKNLASQTAKATEDIQKQISDIQNATKSAVGGIDKIGGTIERINTIQSSIAAAVEQQGTTTKEISRNVQEAASRTMLVSRNITDVSQALEKTGTAATEMLISAEGLSQQSMKLKGEVNNFLGSVRGDEAPKHEEAPKLEAHKKPLRVA